MIEPAEQPVHILVVDDDPRIRQMLTRYFQQEGYRVSAAADGAAMRAQLNETPVDVILLDVVMPGEDGLTLAREIRAKSDVEIIMLTAETRCSIALSALKSAQMTTSQSPFICARF